MLITHIAGIPHRKPNLALLSVGDSVALEPEPDNKFDPNAIRVMHGTPATHLGYIPKDKTESFRFATTATIIEIMPDRRWQEVIIEAATPV